MRQFAVIAAIAVLAAGCDSGAANGDEDHIVISGRALNLIGPVKNAEVTLSYRQTLARTSTDDTGQFVLTAETPDALVEQEQPGKTVLLRVSALYRAEIGGAPCTALTYEAIRFRHGQWVDARSGEKPAILVQGFECDYPPPFKVCCSGDPRLPPVELVALRSR
jgi:hypothetical protein